MATSDGGAIFLSHSRMYFKHASIANFVHNTAGNNGGAVFSENKSEIIFGKNSLIYKENSVGKNGGVIFSTGHHNVSTALFAYNRARLGGALFYSGNLQVTFDGKSTVNFFGNHAQFGGAAYSRDYSSMSFKEKSIVSLLTIPQKNTEVVYKLLSTVV